MLRDADGFTIVEVTIFLAISGLLLLMAIVGTGSLASRQRFSDTTDSLQAYFQGQYDEVLNGVNVRSSGTDCAATSSSPGKSNCLLIGKLLTISSDGKTIQSSYVISTHTLTPTESSLSDSQKLAAAALKVSTQGQSTYELKWSAAVAKATRSTQAYPAGVGRGDVDSIGFLRVPDSGRIVQVYYNSITGALPVVLANDTRAFDPVSAGSSSPSLVVCIKNDNDFASASQTRSAVAFGQGRGASSVTTNYNPGVLCQ